MGRALGLVIGLLVGLSPVTAAGSAGYGDPPGWCTRYSDMWTQAVHTNNPLVATNPERDTFYGFHPNPGYDDWYGYFYGDFRGTPGDRSGWVKLLHENYPDHYSWNFANNGWAVHGHVKQYIAYYNWTFGGQCGLGRYGSAGPAPYMADQFGWPVVDIYVDARPPYPPAPRVVAATPASASFTWDAVGDQGDGAGVDYFESGVDHYTSWISINGGSPLQLQATPSPRRIDQSLANGQTACVHVVAVDRVGNASADQSACATALQPPPMPDWGPLGISVAANPRPLGLVGFPAWLWLDPAPQAVLLLEKVGAVTYRINATPAGVTWDFGDGAVERPVGSAAYGASFPAPSPVSHVFQAHSRLGYVIAAAVTYQVSWSALVTDAWSGPYPMGSVVRETAPLVYPVEQAQPEIVVMG